MMTLNPKHLEQLEKKGISKEKAIDQLQTFKVGIPPVTLVRAAVISDGILRLSAQEQEVLCRYFEAQCSTLKLLKFIPSSGAASRMFTSLFTVLEDYNPEQETLLAYIERTGDTSLHTFIKGLEQLPFYERVVQRIPENGGNTDETVYRFIQEMLREDGLNYGGYPKALLPFHKYGSETATPFEEHVKEAVLYAKQGKVRLHFTISKQHEALFRAEEARVIPKIAKVTGAKFEITYSHQKPSTDTIAVDMENNPLVDDKGAMVLRPGGHGALIENLNEQDADLIFVKNIDNVVVDTQMENTATYKKLLAGVLLQLQTQVFQYAALLESGNVSPQIVLEIQSFLEDRVNVCLPESYAAMDIASQCTVLRAILNRPLRVCGMVRAEGDPGGGPFWVKDAKGNISLQIVESAQMDTSDPQQAAIAKSTTHFNPVDLVCGVRNHKGEKYNLLHFVNAQQGFITRRTKEGKTLKALELPGLWNGAMAFWNTVFVEVPRETFNPVKTVTDLLKPTHQVQHSLKMVKGTNV